MISSRHWYIQRGLWPNTEGCQRATVWAEGLWGVVVQQRGVREECVGRGVVGWGWCNRGVSERRGVVLGREAY